MSDELNIYLCEDVRQKLKSLGAIKYGCLKLVSKNIVTGLDRVEFFKDIVYFINRDMEEVAMMVWGKIVEHKHLRIWHISLVSHYKWKYF